jgi:hypothetical protein
LLEVIRGITEEASETLGITRSIRSVYIGETDSPWNEKALIKRKGGLLDVKITVWPDTLFLFGRVFRLFLYIRDVLDPEFQYNPKIAPDENEEPEITARYNQIWSLYVDSRMERRSIDNFFDRKTRQNLFVDMEKQLSWKEAKAIFKRLWERPSFTYDEIIRFSYHLDTSKTDELPQVPVAIPLEVEINARMKFPHVREHIERIPSVAFRNMTNDILSFTAYHCKDCYIDSSYYGISFLYQRRVFVELIPTSGDLIYFTYMNPDTNSYETETITGPSDLEEMQTKIKTIYHAVSAHNRNV